MLDDLMPTQSDVTDREIEAALNKVAQLIHLYGEAYWPIFERLDQELELRQARAPRLKARLASNRGKAVRLVKTAKPSNVAHLNAK